MGDAAAWVGTQATACLGGLGPAQQALGASTFWGKWGGSHIPPAQLRALRRPGTLKVRTASGPALTRRGCEALVLSFPVEAPALSGERWKDSCHFWGGGGGGGQSRSCFLFNKGAEGAVTQEKVTRRSFLPESVEGKLWFRRLSPSLLQGGRPADGCAGTGSPWVPAGRRSLASWPF